MRDAWLTAAVALWGMLSRKNLQSMGLRVTGTSTTNGEGLARGSVVSRCDLDLLPFFGWDNFFFDQGEQLVGQHAVIVEVQVTAACARVGCSQNEMQNTAIHANQLLLYAQ
jgi:hypothetical protein